MSNSNTIIRTYKYRLYPNRTQEQQLDRIFSFGWRIYNDALHMRQLRYQETGETISLYDLRDYWCELRHVYRDTLGLIPASSVDALIRRLDKAYKAFFRRLKAGEEKAGFPKSKVRHHFKSLEYLHGAGCKLLDARLRIMNVGEIRAHIHRPIPDGAKIKYIIVKQDKQGRWWAACQLQMNERPLPDRFGDDCVGIDVGMVYLLALSDGQTVDNPRWYREMMPKRQKIARNLDQKRRTNNPDNYNPNGTVKENAAIWRKSNRMKIREAELRKLESKIAQQRWNFWHEITDELTRRYRMIALENLTLDFMQQNKRASMSVADASFGAFWQILEYKAEERGVELRWVTPAYTSQTCSLCGHVHKENRKTQADFACVACGFVENADLNAARNILNLALNGQYSPVRGTTGEKGSSASRKALKSARVS